MQWEMLLVFPSLSSFPFSPGFFRPARFCSVFRSGCFVRVFLFSGGSVFVFRLVGFRFPARGFVRRPAFLPGFCPCRLRRFL